MPNREKELTFIGRTPLVNEFIHRAAEEMADELTPILMQIEPTQGELRVARALLKKAAKQLAAERKAALLDPKIVKFPSGAR